MVYLTCAIFGLSGRDEIIHRQKRQQSSPLYADAPSQNSAASFERFDLAPFIFSSFSSASGGKTEENGRRLHTRVTTLHSSAKQDAI